MRPICWSPPSSCRELKKYFTDEPNWPSSIRDGGTEMAPSDANCGSGAATTTAAACRTTVEVNEGRGGARHHPPAAGQPGAGSAVRWNCKGRQVRDRAGGDQRPPAADVCMTRMSTFDESETVTITPLRTFPVIRDLVTDVSFNYEKARDPVVRPAYDPAARRVPDGADRRGAQPGVPQVHRVLPVPERLPRGHDHEGRRSPGRGSMRSPKLDMHRSTPSTARRWRRTLRAGLLQHHQKCCTEVCPEQHQDHQQRAHPDEGRGRP